MTSGCSSERRLLELDGWGVVTEPGKRSVGVARGGCLSSRARTTHRRSPSCFTEAVLAMGWLETAQGGSEVTNTEMCRHLPLRRPFLQSAGGVGKCSRSSVASR